MKLRVIVGSFLLIGSVVGTGAALASWKLAAIQKAQAEAGQQHEPMESVTASIARAHQHRRTTTSIGTVLALRSITLKNELPGTVRKTALTSGQIVEEGSLLISLDVSVEEAELKALEARAALAETLLGRAQRLSQSKVAAEEELDRARAERDVALAQIARTKAIIARKTIRAPFKARVGMADVHAGQFLAEGAYLTTLQGVDNAVHVDFSVGQNVAATLREGETVEVFAFSESPILAKIVAIDAKVDPATRNAWVRARVEGSQNVPSPGSSVRVRTPVGPPLPAVAVPASALRRGAGGDHVFVLAEDKEGKTRAQLRPVVSGPMIGDEVLIYSGIKPGDKIAASGSFKLREAALVVIASDQPKKDTQVR